MSDPTNPMDKVDDLTAVVENLMIVSEETGHSLTDIYTLWVENDNPELWLLTCVGQILEVDTE